MDAGATVVRLPHNRGKGAAVKVGFAWAAEHSPGEDVVCAVRGPPWVGGGLDAGGEAVAGDGRTCGAGGAFQPAGVNVHQRQR